MAVMIGCTLILPFLSMRKSLNPILAVVSISGMAKTKVDFTYLDNIDLRLSFLLGLPKIIAMKNIALSVASMAALQRI